MLFLLLFVGFFFVSRSDVSTSLSPNAIRCILHGNNLISRPLSRIPSIIDGEIQYIIQIIQMGGRSRGVISTPTRLFLAQQIIYIPFSYIRDDGKKDFKQNP